jgi:hypothetical protein
MFLPATRRNAPGNGCDGRAGIGPSLAQAQAPGKNENA